MKKINVTFALVALAALTAPAWAQTQAPKTQSTAPANAQTIPAAPATPGTAASAAPAPPPSHQMFTAKDLKWDDFPGIPGAKVALLEGPMNEAKPFIARLKIPANGKIGPHWHPAIEH